MHAVAPGDHLTQWGAGVKKKKKSFPDNPQPARVTLPISCQPPLLHCRRSVRRCGSFKAHWGEESLMIVTRWTTLMHATAQRRVIIGLACIGIPSLTLPPSAPWKLMLSVTCAGRMGGAGEGWGEGRIAFDKRQIRRHNAQTVTGDDGSSRSDGWGESTRRSGCCGILRFRSAVWLRSSVFKLLENSPRDAARWSATLPPYLLFHDWL